MIELSQIISIMMFSIMSVYLLSRFKLIPESKVALIERFGVFYKPIHPGIHFIIPFVDRLILYNQTRELNLNREVIVVNGESKLSLSMLIQYRIVDEKDFHETNVDQFMRELIVNVVISFIERYGVSDISYQKLALLARLKGIILEKIVEWGIELSSIEILGISEIPSYH